MRLLNIKAALFLLCGLVFAVGCDDDDSDFKGGDNYITSFCLTRGETTLTASILDDSLKIVVPEDFSFDGIRPEFSVSENATISPDPATVTAWDGEQRFTVTSYKGQHAREYVYTVEKSAVIRVGNITLCTQADVDAFGAAIISEIDGNLTIGQVDGEETIETLEPLSHLRKIKHNLTINPTYVGEDLAGLDNLEEVSAVVLHASSPVKKLCLPKLQRVYLNFDFSGIAQLQEIEFPALESIEGNLKLSSLSALTDVKLPKLQSVSSLTINSCSALKSVSMPALEEAETFTVSYNNNLQEIDFTALRTVGGRFTLTEGMLESVDGLKALASVGDLTLQNLNNLTNLNGLKALTTISESVTVSRMSSLEDVSGLSSLASVSKIYFSDIPAEDYSFLEIPKSIASISFSRANIQELDIRNINGLTSFSVENNNVSFTLIGNEITSLTQMTLYAPEIKIEGIKELTTTDYFSYWVSGSSTESLQLNIKKITGAFRFYLVAAVGQFDAPDLEEINGELSFYVQGRSRVNMPSLKKVGTFDAGNCCNMELLLLPALETVKGNFNIRSNDFYGGHLDGISMPALTTIGGKLTLNAYQEKKASLELINFPLLTAVTAVEIKSNMGLFDFSGMKSVIPILTPETWTVSGNGYNPQYQDMVDGNWKKE